MIPPLSRLPFAEQSTRWEVFWVSHEAAAADPTALDVAAVALIGHEPKAVPTIAAAVRRGWTTGRLADLEMLGDDLLSMRVTGFRLPTGGRSQVDKLPAPLRCYCCHELCPEQAIALRQPWMGRALARVVR